MLLDALALGAAFVLAYETRNEIELFQIPVNPPRLGQYIPTLLLHAATTLLVFYGSQLYHLSRSVSTLDQMRRILGATLLGAVLAFGLQGLLLEQLLSATEYQVDYPRSLFFYVLLFSIVIVEFGRGLFRSLRGWLRRRGVDSENLLIIGAGKVARDITVRIRQNASPGYNIIGIVTRDSNSHANLGETRVIGHYEDIPQLIDDYLVAQVIIALPEAHRSELEDIINLCRRGQVDIKVFPDLFAWVAGDLNVDELGGTPLLTVRDIALRGWKLSLKRGMDILLSLLRAGFAFADTVADRVTGASGICRPGFLYPGAHGPGWPAIPHDQVPFDARERGRKWPWLDDRGRPAPHESGRPDPP